MRSGTIAFLLGICALLRCPTVPFPPGIPSLVWPALALIGLLCGLAARKWPLRLTCCGLAGFLWAAWRATLLLDGALPQQLEGLDLQVEGQILDLPRIYGAGPQRRIRFTLHPERLEKGTQTLTPPGRLLISWYQFPTQPRAGERWRFCVRLKRAHGFVNPAGLDRERHLFLQGIRAIGYVCQGQEPRRIKTAQGITPLLLRASLREALLERMGREQVTALILALTLGDRGLIAPETWQVLRRTGTNHLLAVSGLHIGLAAGLAWWAIRWLWSLATLACPCCLWLPAQRCATLVAIPAALGYALLAGFSVPTQRALIMLTVLLCANLGRTRPAAEDGLALAALGVLLWDPWAAAAAGFWLSFIAVATIMLCYYRRVPGGVWWRWGRLQLLIIIALAPPLLLWFQEWPALGSLINLVAIPWMSFLILPTALTGTALLGTLPTLGGLLLDATANHLEWLWQLLEWVATSEEALWRLPKPTLPALIAGTLGILLCIAPLPWNLRMLGPLWMSPLFLGATPATPPQGHMTLALLDVGQGLAAVVETHKHTLVYDTGPRFSGGFNAGDAVLAPYLLSRNKKKIDKLVLSHADSDHIGGLQAILKGFSTQETYSGEPVPGINTEPCRNGQSWTWDHVRFEFLYPIEPTTGNNASCVLKISAAGHAILLTGDLEAPGERTLIKQHAGRISAEVLLLPHHGSRTSSTIPFITAVKPTWVLVAAGYRNRFHLPNQEIIKRYTSKGSKVLNTANTGMIQIKTTPQGLQLTTERNKNPRIWRRP